ncbi:MAG: ABC transporter permease [Methanobacteriaceae archaeon]|nr:ABC transporter permease [Methanobacteriaceae archaeon]
MIELKKFWWMIKKDILVLFRHKARLISMIVFPILMIALCGYGMGGDLTNSQIVIVKQTDGQLTDQTIAAIKADDTYKVDTVITDPKEAKDKVDNGEEKAAIILPADYEDKNSSKNVLLYIDSSDQTATSSIVPKTEALFAKLSSELETQMATPQNPIAQTTNSIKLQVDKIYGDIDYIDFLLPGVLAMSMFMSSMFSMGNSIAGERERGELARLFMTPTSIATVIGGKIVSHLSIEFVRSIILIISAIALFGVVLNGSVVLLLLLLILATLCFVGFGTMFSATAKSQEDYTQMIMPFTMPMMFISGVFFPIETMPWILQKLAYVVPLTYANDALRAVMLQGAGIGDIAIDILVLLGFTVLFFAIAVKRFNRDI